MKNLILTTLASFIFLFSCQKEPNTPLSKYDQDKISILNKLRSAPSGSGVRSNSVFSEECEIVVTSNCKQIEEEISLDIDISECSSHVTDNCTVIGAMKTTVCIYRDYIIVDFVEGAFAHLKSCITDDDLHEDDWDCINNKFYQAYIAYMMPIIMSEYSDFSICGEGGQIFLSRYTKQQCTYPCIQGIGDYQKVSLLQCGSSTACCVEYNQWCYDNTEIEVTPAGNYQIGECSSGDVPCPKIKGGLPIEDTCRPRNCSIPPLPRSF
ncbi:MAG TPA: hypothetical protein PKD16_07280 [Saprospiraceae bacterium]|jgi:hypothetical protein|nr:hypothetical protein [Saprospiraceae bacterium]HMT69946.1 hypothetical protein [Saprospiraceae bacterium]